MLHSNGRLSFVMSLVLALLMACGAMAESWRAEWIGIDGQSKPNTWLCYRKQLELSSDPKKVVARIACDSKYWLWVNGEMVVFEGQLKRGPTPEGTYYDEVELTRHLQKGRNTIAVLVWYWGKHGFSHNSSGKAGLIFESKVRGKYLLSDDTWKVRIHPAYGSTDGPHPNYRLSEANILFDARKDIEGWYLPDYNDSAWVQAKEFGTPPIAPWNQLEKRPVNLWKNSGLLGYVSVEKKEDEKGNQVIIGKLSYNAQVTPYLKVKAPAGQQIDIRTDNYMGGSAPSVRAIYVTREGVQEYESLGWMNGHDVCYTVPKDVAVIDVKYRETGYDADFVGEFDCDDDALNVLWEKSRRTLYITMRDNYMDCPDRERAQWWGDMVNELGEAFYVFDSQKGPLLAKKGIYELARWQRDDKTLYSPVPSGRPNGRVRTDKQDGIWDIELPRQMLASVGWYGFWTYYKYTGDKQAMVDVYPHVRDYLSIWKLGDNGLVIHRPGDWDWTDWGDNKDVPVIENAWLYLALKAAVEMAKLSGNNADIPLYQEKMDSIEANFNKSFWQGKAYCSLSYKGQTDDRAQAMAVVAGFAKEEYYPAIREVLKKEFHASPYMEKYVLESLYLMGSPEQAIVRMKQRWAKQIESDLTTLWEGWGLGNEGFGGGTYNHAWSGGALTVLCQYGAGVSPSKPGYEEYAVLPQMGILKRIDSLVPTANGNIEVHLKRSTDRFTMKLDSPSKLQAVVGVPKDLFSFTEITINGRTIWKDGKQMRNAKGVRFEQECEQWIKFRLDAGQWKWTIEAK